LDLGKRIASVAYDARNPLSGVFMRSFVGKGGSSGRTSFLALALLIAEMAAGGESHGKFEGVWKLEPAQAALKPADGGQIPFTAEGRQAYERNQASAAQGDYSFDPTETRCSSPGLPRLMLTPMLIKIYQRPLLVAMLFEWNRLFREVIMSDALTLKNPMQEGIATGGGEDIGTDIGTPTGHWEGNTLVAQTSKFSEAKLLDEFIPNSANLQITERFRLTNDDTLQDRITIVDPQYFTRPWDAVLTYKRQPDSLYPFREDVCLDRKKAGGLPLPR
jgi:hypothetical protein